MKDGQTPLHLAVNHGHLDIVEALLATEGVDLNAKVKDGQTPLHMVASNGHLDIIESVISHGWC
jgi:ankyrin repeat protein